MSARKLHVEVLANPGDGRPWVVSVVAANRFIWKMYDSYKSAMAAAATVTAEEVLTGADFTVTIAKAPTPIPTTCAIQAMVEHADLLLAEALSKGNS